MDAVDAAQSGQTVVVGPGTYFGTIKYQGKNVTVVSAQGPERTIIDGNRAKGVVIGPGGTIQGFTIRNAWGDFGAGIEANGYGSRILDNQFTGNQQSAGGFGAGIGGNTASPHIEGNAFRSNSCDSQFLSGVVSFVNSSSPTIVNNIFEDNACRAINLTLPTGTSPQVVNNVMVRNAAGIRVDRRVPSDGYIIRNNIIVDNAIGLEVDFGTESQNPTWENNLVWRNSINYEVITDQTGMNGNISADPLFTGFQDYRLRPGSPAIDTGTPIGAPALDFDDVLRPIDGDADGNAKIDMGAFEAAEPSQ